MQSESPQVSALLHEKFEALLDECEQVMDQADHGRTLHDLDDFFCTKGHEFLQEVFPKKLQERITKTEAAPEGKQCPHCNKKARMRHLKPKTIAAVHSHLTLQRRYRYCRHYNRTRTGDTRAEICDFRSPGRAALAFAKMTRVCGSLINEITATAVHSQFAVRASSFHKYHEAVECRMDAVPLSAGQTCVLVPKQSFQRKFP